MLPTVTTPFYERRSRAAPSANQHHYQHLILYTFLPDLAFHSYSCVNQSLKLIRIASYKLITVNSYFINYPNSRMTSYLANYACAKNL